MSTVRTALFVPATQPERITKAINTLSDVVVVDLEDAVSSVNKTSARDSLRKYLLENPAAKVAVRINAAGTEYHKDDINLCLNNDSITHILLPKVESAECLTNLSHLRQKVWAIIESAAGLQNINEVSGCGNVERLCLGSLDLGLELGLTNGSMAAANILNVARYKILISSSLNKLKAPLDGVYPAIKDLKGLSEYAVGSRDMGFEGILCIHPNQIDVIHSALKPDDQTIKWARKVMSIHSTGQAVFAVDGQMIDAPVIEYAKRLLNYLE